MRYAAARFKKHDRELAYRNYVTDALYAIVNGGHFGFRLERRYSDFVTPVQKPPEDTRTQDEIVAQVWSGITGKKVDA